MYMDYEIRKCISSWLFWMVIWYTCYVVFCLLKMDSRSLAMEIAPIIMWQKEQNPDSYKQYWSPTSRSPSKKSKDPSPTFSAWDMLSGEPLETISVYSTGKRKSHSISWHYFVLDEWEWVHQIAKLLFLWITLVMCLLSFSLHKY